MVYGSCSCSCLSIYLSICKLENEAILRDFLSFWIQQRRPFCETSSILEVDTVKNERILLDFLQEWKDECRADGLASMRFAIFPLHLSYALRLPRKSDAKLLTSLMNMSLARHLPRKMHLSRPSSNVPRPRLPSFLKLLQDPHVLLNFGKVQNTLCLPRKATSERPKVLRTPQFFALLTSKCA